jgi:hypothetical protein
MLALSATPRRRLVRDPAQDQLLLWGDPEPGDSAPVLADQIIRLSSPQGQACYLVLLSRFHYRDPETSKEFTFLTNRLDLSALEVVKLYRRRWQIDSFKRIKQSLKIKPFNGTSKNAVLIQI